MKNITRSIVFLLFALAMPVIYGGQPAPGAPGSGVAGVDVIVKQRPGDRAVTDARGNFTIEALAGGSYTLTFRARKAEDLHHHISDRVIIASSYSIKIDGTKRTVSIDGLTSNNLLAGYDINVDLGPGARIRGQVAAGTLQKMVWIPKEVGSNIPGHWAAEDSAEAMAAPHLHAERMSVADLRKNQK
jgi:hypothetical protein